jgi:hypothetical protein
MGSASKHPAPRLIALLIDLPDAARSALAAEWVAGGGTVPPVEDHADHRGARAAPGSSIPVGGESTGTVRRTQETAATLAKAPMGRSRSTPLSATGSTRELLQAMTDPGRLQARLAALEPGCRDVLRSLGDEPANLDELLGRVALGRPTVERCLVELGRLGLVVRLEPSGRPRPAAAPFDRARLVVPREVAVALGLAPGWSGRGPGRRDGRVPGAGVGR